MSGARGRPLRFLGMVLGGWIVLRAALLMPEAAQLPRLIAPQAAASAFALESLPPRLLDLRPDNGVIRTPPPARTAGRTRRREAIDHEQVLALLGRIGFDRQQRDAPRTLIAPFAPAADPPPADPASMPTAAPDRPRLSGTGWLALRGGRGDGLGPGGQLGGSQAGVRLRYALGASRRIALSARASTPLRGRGAELGMGVEWRPILAPVALIAEQRVGLDGSPGGPTIMAVAGIDPAPILSGFSLEGYGQAGGVLRDSRVEPFADGALRLAASIDATEAWTIGLGAWGAVQRDAGRLDIGPSLAVRVPVGPRALRLSLDWRQRLAGAAEPGSGPALTLGSDF